MKAEFPCPLTLDSGRQVGCSVPQVCSRTSNHLLSSVYRRKCSQTVYAKCHCSAFEIVFICAKCHITNNKTKCILEFIAVNHIDPVSLKLRSVTYQQFINTAYLPTTASITYFSCKRYKEEFLIKGTMRNFHQCQRMCFSLVFYSQDWEYFIIKITDIFT